MGLWDILTNLVATNLNMGIENILLLIIVTGALIFMARSFALGLILLLFIDGGLFMLMYNYGLNYAPFIAVFFITLVLLVFTLFASSKQAESGAVI